jgi:mono/diheme cytochrome c family protein/plastocyanin
LHRPRHTTFAIAALAAGSLVLAACGRDDADLQNGKTLFASQCGSCHKLARAGSQGTLGPDLDHAFATPRQDGMTAETVEGIVNHQIAYPRRGSIMPADLVKGQNAADVAAYVGYAAGVPGKDPFEVKAPKGGGKPVVIKGGKATIAAVDGTQFSATKATGVPGNVTLVMPNRSPLVHDISIKGGGVNKKGNQVPQGGTSTVSAVLKAGTYEFYCSVPGHEQAGMKGTLTIK